MRFALAAVLAGFSSFLAGCISTGPPPYTSPVPAPSFYVKDEYPERRFAYHDSDPRSQKLAVVLIHGLGGGSVAWSGLLEEMSAYRVISIDLLGHGESSAPEDFDYSMSSQAECIARLLDTLGIMRYVVVGASYGGGVAAELARTDANSESRQLAGLVLIGAAALDFPPPPTLNLALNPIVRWWLVNVSSGRSLARIFLDSSFHRRQRVPAWLVEGMAVGLAPKSARQAVARGGIRMFAELQERATDGARYCCIECPTLLIWGEHDRTVPRSVMERLCQTLPCARSVVISDCGHTPHEECPSALSGHLLEFLDTLK